MYGEKPAVTVPNGDEAAFFALIRAAFSQRRKTAANAIANGLHLPKAQVISALQAAGLDERSRPEQLTLENYCALQTALANTKYSKAKRPVSITPTGRFLGVYRVGCNKEKFL